MTMNKLVDIYNYLTNPNNWCEPQYRTFYKWFSIYVLASSYLMIGLYQHYPEVLDMLFWPFN